MTSTAAPETPDPNATHPAVNATIPMRVYHDPYGSTDWVTNFRLKAQHHDHVAASDVGIRAYDDAGYDVMSLMNYSGVASQSYSWHELHWPATDWVSAKVLASLKHIKFFLPNTENGGYGHITTPFLTKYVSRYEPDYNPVRTALNYGGPGVSLATGTQQSITLVDSLGGFPMIAHPWTAWSDYEGLRGYKGTEIYSGYVSFKRLEGIDPTFVQDLNPRMQEWWDKMLMRDQSIIGIAVNDHFGPDYADTKYGKRLRDSGKIIVLAEAQTYDSYVAAFKRGAILAIKDWGETKDAYPRVSSIVADATSITINTASDNDDVLWISNGNPVSTSRRLELASLPSTAKYVRAVISNADGSQVFTQAIAVRLLGDVDGDGAITAADTAVCTAVAAGSDLNPDRVAACKASGK